MVSQADEQRLSEIRQFLDASEDWDGYEWGPQALVHIRFLLARLDQTQADLDQSQRSAGNLYEKVEEVEYRLSQCQADLETERQRHFVTTGRLEDQEAWRRQLVQCQAELDRANRMLVSAKADRQTQKIWTQEAETRLAKATQHIQNLGIEPWYYGSNDSDQYCYWCQVLRKPGDRHNQDCAWAAAKQWLEKE